MKSFPQKTIIGFCALLFFIYTNPSLAQVNKNVLTLNKAIDLAMNQYPSIQAYMERVNAGQAKVEEAKNLWLPSAWAIAEVAGGTDNNLNGSYYTLGIIPSATGGTRTQNINSVAVNNFAAVTGQWEVFNFGLYNAETREAKSSLGIDQSGLDREKLNIQYLVIKNYFDLVKYSSLLSIQQENIDRTATIKNAILAFVNNGLKPGVDSSVAEAELSKARLTYIELERSRDIVKSRLAALTGIDSSAISADTSINNEIPALLYQQLFSDSAYTQHPYLQYYRSVYNDQLARLSVIRKSYLPKVWLMSSAWMRGSSINPAGTYQKDAWQGLSYSRYNYLTGLAMTYDLFSSKKRNLRLNEQSFATRAARQDLEQEKLILNSNIQQANVALRAVSDKLREIPLQIKAANEAYVQKLAMYNSGLTNIVEVTNALYLLNRAETDMVTANDDAWNAIFNKAFAGNTIPTFLKNLK